LENLYGNIFTCHAVAEAGSNGDEAEMAGDIARRLGKRGLVMEIGEDRLVIV
jgi:hypothetical protein